MKVLFVYNSVDPQSVAGAAMAKLLYPDCTLKDIMGITTGNISTWIGTLSAVYGLILIGYSMTTAATGVISPAQQILLDAKCAQTVLKTGTASASSSTNTLTQATGGWVVNAYANCYVKTTDHTGLNQIRKVLSNSATVLTLDSAWTTGIDNTTDFSICATRDEFSWDIFNTSGSNKQAIVMWEHAKLFAGVDPPLLIYKLAGDKTTASVAVNAQNVLDESYVIKGVKYLLRDLTDAEVLSNWKKLLFNGETPDLSRAKTQQDLVVYDWVYDVGKYLIDTAAALTITL